MSKFQSWFSVELKNIFSAEILKEQGNEYYKKRDYERAVSLYTQSIEIQETAAWYIILGVYTYYLVILIAHFVTFSFITMYEPSLMQQKQFIVILYL